MGYSDLADRLIISSGIPKKLVERRCLATIKLPMVSDQWQLCQDLKSRLCKMHPRCRVTINLFQGQLSTRIERV